MFIIGTKWTEEEILKLKELCIDTTDKEIGKILNKSKDSVRKKRKRLGIHKEEHECLWTEEESELLKKLYPITNNKEILKFFPNRTSTIAIRSYAEKLGLNKEKKIPKIRPKMNYWSTKDDEFLKNNYKVMDYSKIAIILNRTEIAVHSRLSNLHITSNNKFSAYEINYLKENYLKNTVDEMSLFLGRPNNSVTDRLCDLKLWTKWWTKEEDERLRKNYSTLSMEDLLLEFPNRTKNGISDRAVRLKITGKKFLWKDDIPFDSKSEMLVYYFIKDNYNVDIIKVINEKMYNPKYKENYIPDFIICDNNTNKKYIVEYFGLYYEEYGTNEFLKQYHDKTLRKTEYFNDLKEFDFIPIFYNDIKKKNKGLIKKLDSLFMSNLILI